MRTAIAAMFALLCLSCLMSTLAFADSVHSIPISGDGYKGQPFFTCCFSGDFDISGPGLSLSQGTPDGPTSIGFCTLGQVCDFSYSFGSTAEFCTYCTGLSSGTLGNKTADFLDASMTFTGSALYSGGSTVTVPMTVSGMIVGYELVNCTDGVACSLGPVEFRLKIVGTGQGTAYIQNFGDSGLILGTITNFTGFATTVVPEPISLVLTGTGLVGVWIRKRLGSPRTC